MNEKFLKSSNVFFSTQIDSNKIFGNIKDVYESNIYFWIKYLLPVLNETRNTGKKLDPIKLLDAFLQVRNTYIIDSSLIYIITVSK